MQTDFSTSMSPPPHPLTLVLMPDTSVVNMLLTELADLARAYGRLVSQLDRDHAFDAAPLFGHLATVEELLALVRSARCRCGRLATRERDTVEVCEACAHPANQHTAPASPTIGERRAVLRLLAATITDEGWDELEGRGVIGAIAERLERKPANLLKELCDGLAPVSRVTAGAGEAEDYLPLCSVCGQADGHAPDCAVDALVRLGNGGTR